MTYNKRYEFPELVRKNIEQSDFPIAIYQMIDGKLKTILVTEGLIKMQGMDRDSLIAYLDTDMYDRILSEDVLRIKDDARRFLSEGKTYNTVYRQKIEGYEGYRVIHASGYHRIVDEETRYSVVRYDDATDAQYFDTLTDLPNMNYLIGQGRHFIEKITAEDMQPVIIYFDVKGMRNYNSKYGFNQGNKFLKKVVASSKGAVTSIKAGIYTYQDDRIDIGTSSDYAKLACKAVKNDINKTYKYFTSKLKIYSDMQKYVINNIDTAIKEEYIKVFYQPVIKTSNGKLCGFEALARWINPKYGMLSPDNFVGALEDSHQIYKLDSYMIKQICRKLKDRLDKNKKVVPVSFNLSRLDFLNCDIFSIVNGIVSEYEIPKGYINIEITESIVASDPVVYSEIRRFRQAGYAVWMDDFGSGYSSLNSLKDYEFDELKIDMDFLSSFTEKSKSIITCTVEMAKRIGIETLAEGVETDEQYTFLKNIGCEKVQGYLFGKPLPDDECLDNLVKKEIIEET